MKIYKENIIEFLKDKKFMIVLILVTILAYGFTLTNFSVGVDDLSLDRYVSDTYILSQGRWGTFLIYNILGIREFTPFWLDFVTLGVIVLTAIFMCAFLKRISNSKLKNSSYIIFSCGFISCPVISNFFVYQPTNLTVAISNFLVIIALAILYENFIDKKNKKLDLISILLLIFSVSMYEACAQTFVVLMFIIGFIYFYFNTDVKFQKYFKFIINCIITLCIALIINSILNLLISRILELINMKQNVYSHNKTIITLLGEKISFTVFLGVMSRKFSALFSNDLCKYFLSICILGLICVLGKSKKNKNYKLSILFIFIILSNFILNSFMIMNLFRVCYSWAITIGFILLFINEIFEIKYIVSVLIGFVILMQTKTMNQLFYNEYLGYRRDVLYANSIINSLQEIDSSLSKPILFVKSEKSIKANLKLNEDNRDNYFEWALTAFDENSTEIVKFFAHLGYNITVVEDYDEATEIYENLGENLMQENIIELEDFIVVKLEL